MSMKKSNDTIGDRTRDFPACSAVPQPTAPPCAPIYILRIDLLRKIVYFVWKLWDSTAKFLHVRYQ